MRSRCSMSCGKLRMVAPRNRAPLPRSICCNSCGGTPRRPQARCGNWLATCGVPGTRRPGSWKTPPAACRPRRRSSAEPPTAGTGTPVPRHCSFPAQRVVYACGISCEGASMNRRFDKALRVLLSSQVTTGVSAGFGLWLVSASTFLLFGQFPPSVAAVGAIICIPPDHALPRRGKLLSLLPAALLGLPLFLSVQALLSQPLYLGMLLVPATFFAFLAGAWGQRGVPIVISIMFAMIFSMAVPQHLNQG